jgi:hypothetical protein
MRRLFLSHGRTSTNHAHGRFGNGDFLVGGNHQHAHASSLRAVIPRGGGAFVVFFRVNDDTETVEANVSLYTFFLFIALTNI